MLKEKIMEVMGKMYGDLKEMAAYAKPLGKMVKDVALGPEKQEVDKGVPKLLKRPEEDGKPITLDELKRMAGGDAPAPKKKASPKKMDKKKIKEQLLKEVDENDLLRNMEQKLGKPLKRDELDMEIEREIEEIVREYEAESSKQEEDIEMDLEQLRRKAEEIE